MTDPNRRQMTKIEQIDAQVFFKRLFEVLSEGYPTEIRANGRDRLSLEVVVNGHTVFHFPFKGGLNAYSLDEFYHQEFGERLIPDEEEAE